jgi:hypothetical protein
MRYHLIAACLGLTVTSCSEPRQPKQVASAASAYTPPDSSLPEISAIAESYGTFQSMTPRPVPVSYQASTLCVTSAYEQKARESGIAAHSAFISIRMNDSAAHAFRQNKPYPIGSVVLKQKQPFGIGGMVKRPPGYNPDHGDWEYFYFENPRMITTGKLPTCVNCHAAAVQSDYVFGNWANSHQ